MLDQVDQGQDQVALDQADRGQVTLEQVDRCQIDGMETSEGMETEKVGILDETIGIPDTTMFPIEIFQGDTIHIIIQEISIGRYLIDLSTGTTG